MMDGLDRRIEERSDCAIAAKIELSDQLSISVTLKDLSASGVRLQVPASIDLPDEFDLLIPVIDTVELRHRVRIAWRNGETFGGEFLGTFGTATSVGAAVEEGIESDRAGQKR